jgi:hypothetical protein
VSYELLWSFLFRGAWQRHPIHPSAHAMIDAIKHALLVVTTDRAAVCLSTIHNGRRPPSSQSRGGSKERSRYSSAQRCEGIWYLFPSEIFYVSCHYMYGLTLFSINVDSNCISRYVWTLTNQAQQVPPRSFVQSNKVWSWTPYLRGVWLLCLLATCRG